MQSCKDTAEKISFPGNKLAKNSLINLTGFVLPLLVGLITIPLIVSGFGVERFGLLTLAWAIIGYFSLFDMGIGRAITQLVAERFGNVPDREISLLVWTGLMLMSIFALAGAITIATVAPLLISSVLNVSAALKEEATWAFILLALAIPAVVLSAGLAGVLAAIQRFDLINALRIPMGTMFFLVPLAILPFSKSTAHVCASLTVVRLLFLILHAAVCFRTFPQLWTHVGIDISMIGSLLSFGGWMTVTNVIGPLMVYVDRFVIGGMLSVSIVAFYVTPYEMVIRLWALPAAVVTVLFPAFAASRISDINHAKTLYSLGGRAILAVLAPIILVLVVFAEEGLNVWLGSDFSQNSTTVLQWLAIGVYLNSYAQVPFAFIQGIGRADITARLHLIELPLYIVLMFWLLKVWGINGVALAWVIRITLDAILLTLMTHQLTKNMDLAIKQIFPLLAAPLPLFAIGMVMDQTIEKLLFTILSFFALIGIGYRFATTTDEKTAIQKAVRRFFRF